MSDFPATDIAIEGFRLTRERARVVAIWAAIQMVASFGVLAVIYGVCGKQMAAFNAAAKAGRSIDDLARAIEPLMPVLLALSPINLIIQSILMTACFRVILQPSKAKYAFLSIGMDEVRVLLISLALMAMLFVTLVLSRVLGEGVAVIAAAVGIAGRILMVAYMGAVLFGAAFALVRLSLAPALTFARGKFVLAESWRLTRGRHWALGGAYFMAFMLAALVYVLGVVIGSVLQTASSVEATDLKALLSPGLVGSTLWMASVGVLISIIVQAPGAAAVLHLEGRRRD